MKSTISRKVNKNKLSKFVLNHSYGNIFQTPKMYEVYENTRNYKPIYLAVLNDSEEIVGTLLAVIQKEHSGLLGNLSARSIIFGGPLVKDNDINIISFILKEYNKIIKRKAIYSQFRNMWNYSDEEKNIFNKNDIILEEHLDYFHTLGKSENELWQKPKSKTRNKISINGYNGQKKC